MNKSFYERSLYSKENELHQFVAHVRKVKEENAEEIWEEHTWLEHSYDVAKMAGDFAADFGNRDWGEFVGLWHDLGKLYRGWQLHIREKTGYDIDAFIEKEKSDRGNHSTLGGIAIFRRERINFISKNVIAYIITGHHAGLPDYENRVDSCGISLKGRLFDPKNPQKLNGDELEKLEYLLSDDFSMREKVKEVYEQPFPRTPPPFITPEHSKFEAMNLWIRMLFSCLVDADFLDTERFMNKDKFAERGNYASLEELKARLDKFTEQKERSAKKSEINLYRSKILKTCREKAILKPGFFTLTVPTGAGKTLSSMAFALGHALKHGKKRVIVAIPFTSIIEQTSMIYKYGTDNPSEIASGAALFGEANVIEHHSNIDPMKETVQNRLASENWDAPVIVTTNVQLFESLAASKPSQCRKLHNIANSVIILDEPQLLPSEYLFSILSNLKHLVEHFGVTVLFCTATQPAFKGKIGSGTTAFNGLSESSFVELFEDDRESMYRQFKRVNFILPKDGKSYESWEELACELSSRSSVMCVVNTRKSARELYYAMPNGTYHLSGLMCAEDRSDVISEVKNILKSGGTARLISTQLIEAGVDISFPVVYRAFSGLDSIIQAGGRANREGEMSVPGEVIIFNPPKNAGSPPGLLRKMEQAARYILKDMAAFEVSDELFREYFERFYCDINNFDKPDYKDLMLSGISDGSFQFRTYSDRYNLIDDKEQRSVIVPYYSKKTGNSSIPLIKQLESGEWGFSLIRKLQRFSVSVPLMVFEELHKKSYIKQVHESGYGVLDYDIEGAYKPGKGLILPDEPLFRELCQC